MSTQKTPLWLAALSYVAQGYRVIPILPDKKTPLQSKWHENALTTAEAVDTMWENFPNANIAFCPEDMGIAIIDCDPGASDLSAFPPTYTVKTPRGGYHLYYLGSVPPTVGKLGDHIDTRGQRSYALLPPSVVDGNTYVVHNERPAVALPDEIAARLTAADQQTVTSEGRADLPGNVATARTRLSTLTSRGPVAISGRGGNDTTYRVVSELVRDLGITPELSLTLLNEGWNQACVPPWSDAELRTILENVSKYGQNAPGAYATAPPSETFAAANLTASTSEGPDQSVPTPNSFRMLGTKEQDELPEPTWLLRDIMPDRRVIVMSAQKSHFKTFLALDIALAIASDKESFGSQPTSEGLTVYSAHESLEEIAKFHRPAWFAVKGLNQGSEIGFYLTRGLHVSNELHRQQFDEALAELKARQGRPIKLVIFDTYSATMGGLDENSPADANEFIGFCRWLIARHGCAVLVVAHKGKELDRGTRGTSALEYGVDGVIDVTRVDRGMQVKVHARDLRGFAERPGPFHFEARPVAKSLVFHLLTSEERKQLDAKEHNPFSANEIANVLRLMGAVNDQQAVMTRALASSVAVQGAEESDQRYEARVRDTELSLRRLGRKDLQHLTFGSGTGMRWCLPNGEGEDDSLEDLLKT